MQIQQNYISEKVRNESNVVINPATKEEQVLLYNKLPVTAFGDLRTAELTPLFQGSFEYTVDNTDYVYVATATGYSPMSGVIYRDGGGLTTQESEHLLQLVNSTAIGGVSINYGIINTHTSNKINELRKEIDKLPKIIEDGFNDTNSHIDIANTTVLDKIETIEMPKYDMSEITLGIGVLKQRFTKLSEFLRKEADMEKEGIKKELESKIEEIEQAYEDMQNIHSEEIESKTSEVSEKEKLIAEMEETAQELMEVLEKEGKVKKDEVEKEVKEKIISSLSE